MQSSGCMLKRSLLGGIRNKLATLIGGQIASTTFRVPTTEELTFRFVNQPRQVAHVGGQLQGIELVHLMFRALTRLAELHDEYNDGIRLEYEQHIFVRAVFAARAKFVLSEHEYAQERPRLVDLYGIDRDEAFIYVGYPRRRGKSVAIAVAAAILMATQRNFGALVVNYSKDLALVNGNQICKIITQLARDPRKVINCALTRNNGNAIEVQSHVGTLNTLFLTANPNKTDSARGLGQPGAIFIDECEFYKKEAYETIMPVAALKTIVCMISSLGASDNYARTMVDRRDMYGCLVYAIYRILPGRSEIHVSSNKPGKGSAFVKLTHEINKKRMPWWVARPILAMASGSDDLEAVIKYGRDQQFYHFLGMLPRHQSVANFKMLRYSLDEEAFGREFLNEIQEDTISRYAAFESRDIERFNSPQNDFLYGNHAKPLCLVVGMDPSGGSAKSSECVIVSAAYYTPVHLGTRRSTPSEHTMVVCGMEILSTEEARNTNESTVRFLQHAVALYQSNPNYRGVPILAIVENNYGSFHATSIYHAIQNNFASVPTIVRQQLTDFKITMYMTTNTDGTQVPGFLTTNATKEAGVAIMRQRLCIGSASITFSTQIVTTTAGQTADSLRSHLVRQLRNFYVYPPTSTSTNRRKCVFSGKENGNTDDLAVTLQFIDVAYQTYAYAAPINR